MIKVTTQKGFTLLELLVVLVIVAMTASFSGPDLWRAYVKANERSTVRAFAGDIGKLRVTAFHQGRLIVLAAVDDVNPVGQTMPDLPSGWTLERSDSIRFLPTGVTNGGMVYLRSPDSHRWLLKIAPLDGAVEIQKL